MQVFSLNAVFFRISQYELESACVSQAERKEKPSADGTVKKVATLHIENFDISFGSQVLLKNANLHLSVGRRYGLVGRNGYGKTTLLRALAKLVALSPFTLVAL